MKKKKISKKKLTKLITKIILQNKDVLKGDPGPMGPAGPMGRPGKSDCNKDIKIEDIYCDIFESCQHKNLKDQLIHMWTKLRFDIK